jgi:hypothetical protein
MIQYWTTWNYIWYLGARNGYIPVTNSLKLSIFTTSLLGGFMIYIYPRKMITRFGEYKYNVPYPLLVTGDIIFHQLPLLCILRIPNTQNNCASEVLMPIFIWGQINMVRKVSLKKIYGIKMEYLVGTSFCLLGLGGLLYHKYEVKDFTKFIPNVCNLFQPLSFFSSIKI